jgi:hypothetical protein
LDIRFQSYFLSKPAIILKNSRKQHAVCLNFFFNKKSKIYFAIEDARAFFVVVVFLAFSLFFKAYLACAVIEFNALTNKKSFYRYVLIFRLIKSNFFNNFFFFTFVLLYLFKKKSK